MLYEAIAAALVALAVVALIAGPLMQPGVAAPPESDEPDDPEETPKGIALTALREIEFDRATGKLSDEDYEHLKAKYTAEALAILRTEQAPDRGGGSSTSPGREPSDALEALIAERVQHLKQNAIRCPGCGPRPESDALFCSSCGRSLTHGGCASCGAALVPGSRFCESCGSAVLR